MLIGEAYVAVRPEVNAKAFSAQVAASVGAPLTAATKLVSDAATRALVPATTKVGRLAQGLGDVGTRLHGVGGRMHAFADRLSATSGEAGRFGERISAATSKLIGLGVIGVKSAGLLGVGALAAAFAKGFGRLRAIDDAQFKLQGLGHDAAAVEAIMTSALASVKGTAFGLGEAATIAASAVAAGVKPGQDLTRTLSLTGDAASIAGVSLAEMGAIFGKVAAGNRMMTQEMNQLTDRGVPILQWLQEEFGVTADKARDMVSEGEVTFATFQKIIEENIGGAALKAGGSFTGSLANMGAALGRFGAALLGPAFAKGPEVFAAITAKIDSLTEVAKERLLPVFENIGKWWDKNGPAIGNAAGQVAKAIKAVFGVIVTLVQTVIEHWDKYKVAIITGVVIMTPYWVSLGVAATVSAARQVGAWVATRVAAVAARVVHSAAVVVMVAGWAFMGAKAVVNAAIVVGGWVATGAAAVKAGAVMVAQAAVQVARWVAMGAVAMAQAARIAAAWVIAMGPLAIFAAAVIGVAVLVVKNWDKIKDATETLREKITSALKWILDKLLGWAETQLKIVAKALGWVPGLGPKLKQAADDFAEFRQSVNAQMAGVSADLARQVNKANAELGRIAENSPALAARMAAAGAGIGTAFGAGVGRGIDAMAPALRARANAMIDSTIIAARRRAGIQSPSTVAADQIGLPIAQGVALGIENGQITVSNAMTETLSKLVKENASVRAVVNEAHALGVRIPDEMAEGIAKGTIAVGDAMNAVMDAASQIARQRAQEIADEINEGFGAILSGFGGFIGLTGARRAVRNAERDLAQMRLRAHRLPGEIKDQFAEVRRLRKEAREVTLAEEREIIQGRRSVTEAEKRLEEARADGSATADDIRLAEIDLATAQQALESSVRASTAATREQEEAERHLKELQEERKRLNEELVFAEERLTEAQLRLVSAQKDYEEAQKRLIEQGPAGEKVFTDLGLRAGLTADTMERLAASIYDITKAVGQVPTTIPGLAHPGLGPQPRVRAEDLPGNAAALLKRLASDTISPENASRLRQRLEDLGVDPRTQVQRTTTVTINAPVERMTSQSLARELQRVDDMAGR